MIFDVHGVLLGRREPVGHLSAGAVVAAVREAGHPVRLLTNSSSLTRSELAGQLAAAGVQVSPDEIYTAALVAADYIRRHLAPCRLYVIGSAALRQEILNTCGDDVCAVSADQADTVVISRDPGLDDAALRRLARRPALRLIATCRDRQFPTGAVADTGPGPTVQRVEAALGGRAHVVGKPNSYVLTAVMGLSPQLLADTVIVGDSVDQDVMLCKNAGARSVLLLNGTPPPTAAVVPDHSIHALDQLCALLGVGPAARASSEGGASQ